MPEVRLYLDPMPTVADTRGLFTAAMRVAYYDDRAQTVMTGQVVGKAATVDGAIRTCVAGAPGTNLILAAMKLGGEFPGEAQAVEFTPAAAPVSRSKPGPKPKAKAKPAAAPEPPPQAQG